MADCRGHELLDVDEFEHHDTTSATTAATTISAATTSAISRVVGENEGPGWPYKRRSPPGAAPE